MAEYTTQEPWLLVMDEINLINISDIEPLVYASRPVDQAKVAAHLILVILTIVVSLYLLVTVLFTKSVRSQLVGVLLINMAVALLISTVVHSRHLEAEANALHGNFGTAGCHLFMMVSYVYIGVFNATVVLLCVNAVFILPQSVISRSSVTVITFSVVLLYGFASGPKVLQHHRDSMCTIDNVTSIFWFETITLLFYDIVPTVFLIVTLIKCCFAHRINKASQGNILPFGLTL